MSKLDQIRALREAKFERAEALTKEAATRPTSSKPERLKSKKTTKIGRKKRL